MQESVPLRPMIADLPEKHASGPPPPTHTHSSGGAPLMLWCSHRDL